MNKTEDIVSEKTCRTTKQNEEFQKEISKFLQQVTIKNSKETVTLTDIIPQIIASCIIQCIVIKAGINMAFSTVLLNGLEKDSDIRITDSEGSWIASLVTITLPIGSTIAGPLMDRFGRKIVSILSCIPAVISWILLIFAKSVITVYAARIVIGIAAGLTTVGLVYISELTHPQVRPMLLCLNSVFVSLGILITCCLAALLDWRTMAMVFLALESSIFLALYFVPESPYWLCFRSMFDETQLCEMKRNLKQLNRRQTIYEQEYSRIMETYRNRVVSDETSKSVLTSLKTYCRALRYSDAYKPIIILLLLFLLQQLSGSYLIIFYALSIFRETGAAFGKDFDKNSAFVMLGVIRFIISVLTVFFSRKYGRRVLCIVSGIGMTISMFLSGMYMHLATSYDGNGNVEDTGFDKKWLLLIFILSYICASTFGFTNIPWTLIGELLPMSIRGIGGGVIVSLVYLMMFAVVKSYPYIVKSMSIESIFFFFSFTSLMGTTFVYFFLPETLGKSFSDIKSFFSSKPRGERSAQC